MKRKLIITIAVVLIAIMSAQPILAKETKGTGATSGGTGGKTTITYRLIVTARVGGYIDQTQIKMNAGSLNTINMEYSNLQHVNKSGKIIKGSPASGRKEKVNSASWTHTAASAGKAYSSQADYKAKNTAFGTFRRYDVYCAF